MKNKFTVWIITLTVLILVSGVFLATKFSSATESSTSSEAKVSAPDTYYDWGDVVMENGNVEKVFDIKNEGSDDLILSHVATSCMCTTASLSLGNETSPDFGMHTKSSYKLEVPPGETAKLKVVFDPAFHGPSGIGPINRQVKVSTNDPNRTELTFMLTAMVKK